MTAPTSRAQRWCAGGLWLAATAPAAFAFAVVARWSVGIPEPAQWRDAMGELPLCASWDHFADFGGQPNFVVFRAVNLTLLHAPGGDFGRFAVVTWLLALACCFAAHGLIRRAARGSAVLLPPFALVLLSLWLFSPAYGANWLLDTRFRILVPPACLLAAVVVLTSGAGWPARFAISAALAQVALFTDRTGALVWIALAPLVFSEMTRRGLGRRGAALAVWCLLGNVGIALCYDDPLSADVWRSGLVGNLLAHPSETMTFFLSVLGWGVPDILVRTEFDSVLVGATLLAVFVAAVARLARQRALLPAAMPWLTLVVFALLQAALVTESWFPPPITAQLIQERCHAAPLLTLGLCGTAAVAMPGAAIRSVAPVGAGVLLVLLLQAAHSGFDRLAKERRALRQYQALLVFAGVAPRVMPVAPGLPIASRADIAALQRAGRLRRAVPVATLELGEIDVSPARADTPYGIFGALSATTAQGVVAVSGDAASDIVLLTRRSRVESERIFKIAAPSVLTDGDHLPWSVELGDIEPFRDGERVRAFGYDVVRRLALPLAGSFRCVDGRLEPVAESGR